MGLERDQDLWVRFSASRDRPGIRTITAVLCFYLPAPVWWGKDKSFPPDAQAIFRAILSANQSTTAAFVRYALPCLDPISNSM